MNESRPRRVVRKVVAYVVHQEQLLVFTHDDLPIEVTGIQVPAGSIAEGETPSDAAVREVWEEMGLRVRVTRSLGVEHYDMWPAMPELHERHFFELAVLDEPVAKRWTAGEEDSSDGSDPVRWTCWWTPLTNAHVLCAGFSARIGDLGHSAVGT